MSIAYAVTVQYGVQGSLVLPGKVKGPFQQEQCFSESLTASLRVCWLVF